MIILRDKAYLATSEGRVGDLDLELAFGDVLNGLYGQNYKMVSGFYAYCERGNKISD